MGMGKMCPKDLDCPLHVMCVCYVECAKISPVARANYSISLLSLQEDGPKHVLVYVFWTQNHQLQQTFSFHSRPMNQTICAATREIVTSHKPTSHLCPGWQSMLILHLNVFARTSSLKLTQQKSKLFSGTWLVWRI